MAEKRATKKATKTVNPAAKKASPRPGPSDDKADGEAAVLAKIAAMPAPFLVACRSEFVTADAADGVRVFPLDRASIGGVGVDIAAELAS